MSFVRFHDADAIDRGLFLSPRKDAQLHQTLSPTVARTNQLASVVVPLDGTQFAEHAIPLAISIVKRTGGVLRLVRVFMPAEAAVQHHRPDAFGIVEGELRTEVRRYLDRVKRRIAARVPDVSVVTQLAHARRVSEGILRVANTVDLVVIATHRRGWLSRFFLGSVGHEILLSRKQPTIYVRGYDAPVDLSADPVPRHLTIALDGSKASERVLDVAGALARLSGATSTLVHVIDPHDPDEQFPYSSPWGYLNWTRRLFAKIAPDARAHLVRKAPSPTRGILAFIDETESDLLAVTARAVRTTFQSTTENLIRKSSVPVLVVRGEGHRDQ